MLAPRLGSLEPWSRQLHSSAQTVMVPGCLTMPVSLPISHCLGVSGWSSLAHPSWGNGEKPRWRSQAPQRNITSPLQNATKMAGWFPLFMPSVQTKGTKQLCFVPSSSHRNPRDAAWICLSPHCSCCFSRILALFQREIGL